MEELICKRCIMNNTTSFFKLDKDGVCNYCKTHDYLEKQFPINGSEKKIIEKILKKGKNKKFDCVLGLVAEGIVHFSFTKQKNLV